MTKKEALEFLELPETSGDSDIKARLADKLSYFEMLSENSASVFLRRIHEQNLAKVKLIQKEISTWLPAEEKKTPIIQGELIARELPKVELEKQVTEKVTLQPVEIQQPVLQLEKEEPDTLTDTQIVRLKPAPEPVGWLVRHTENKTIKNFPLFYGKNFIGRKLQPGLKPFIEVEDDLFVSRVHAVLNVEGARPYLFYISDTPVSNGGKPSKNGTYVNGSEERVNVKTVLNDYDTVQIGETKFVLRFEIDDLIKMKEEVENKGYMHTVIIKLRDD